MDVLRAIRRLLLGLLLLGMAGTATELVFLEHYESTTMVIPLAAIAVAIVAVLFHLTRDSAATARALRVGMSLLIVTGAVGVALHYRGSLEFQVDMDPTLAWTQLFWKVMHMKAPPTLAPGVMLQFGLLGLIATYRHVPRVTDGPREAGAGAAP